MKLIVNADDFGLTHGVTCGILDAMDNGIVTSTTMMVNTRGTEEAAQIARSRPKLAVGLHINISLGFPLTDCPSLLRDGSFAKPKVLGDVCGYEEADLDRELNAQYRRFVSLVGRKPSHIDSHLYAHQKYPEVSHAVCRLAQREGLPVRDTDTNQYPKVFFQGNFKVRPGENQPDLKRKLMTLLDEMQSLPVAELMVHPGWADTWLQSNSSYHSQRITEYQVLTDPEIKEHLGIMNVQLISFLDMR